MKFNKNNAVIYFCLMFIPATIGLSIGRPFFDYEDGKHSIINPLKPGTNIIRYELHEGNSCDSDSFHSIHHSVVFELTRYLLIIDITKFAEESDKVYEILAFDDKGKHHYTYSFVFNKEKNEFEVFKGFWKKTFFEKYASYIGFTLGAGFSAGILQFLI